VFPVVMGGGKNEADKGKFYVMYCEWKGDMAMFTYIEDQRKNPATAEVSMHRLYVCIYHVLTRYSFSRFCLSLGLPFYRHNQKNAAKRIRAIVTIIRPKRIHPRLLVRSKPQSVPRCANSRTELAEFFDYQTIGLYHKSCGLNSLLRLETGLMEFWGI
jgi:hypothetical protein